MNNLRLERGLWWVASDIECAAVLFEQVKSIPLHVLPYVSDFSLCVQAGGNCGLFPLELAASFDKVITFEPDPPNYEALVANTHSVECIEVHQSALGNSHESICMVAEYGNCGASFVTQHGNIPQTRIDDLNLQSCGLIYLDIEGFEEFVVRGGVETIKKFSPTIVVEMKNLSHRYGRSDKDCSDYLKSLGYRMVHSFDNDFVWRRA